MNTLKPNPVVQVLLKVLDTLDPIKFARIRAIEFDTNKVMLVFQFDNENEAQRRFDEILSIGSTGNASELSGKYQWDLDVYHFDLQWITRRTLYTNSETFNKIYHGKFKK